MRSLLDGPPPALPGPLDRLAERWAMLRPRGRAVVGLAAVLVLMTAQGLHTASVQARWGGDPQLVWRATATIPAGQAPRQDLQRVRLPRAAVPATVVTGPLDPQAVLALPLAAGGLLTTIHLSPAGPAAGLSPDERLVPVPVQASWGIEAGSVVDVWAVDDLTADPAPLATARPVLQLRDDGPQPVALVSLDAGDVAAASRSLTRGRVLLTQRGS